MSLPGRTIFIIFLTLIFLFLVSFPGHQMFIFLTSRQSSYHMKFAIFDVARCRMSATSLTFLFFIRNQVWMTLLLEKKVATLGTCPSKFWQNRPIVEIRGSMQSLYQKGKTPSRRSCIAIAVYLCMITSRSIKAIGSCKIVTAKFLLESTDPIILTDVVRIREEILPWFQFSRACMNHIRRMKYPVLAAENYKTS